MTPAKAPTPAKCDGCGRFVKWADAKKSIESSDLDGKACVYDVRCRECTP